MRKLLMAVLVVSAGAVLAVDPPDLSDYFKVQTVAEQPFNMEVLSEKVDEGLKITSFKIDGGMINGKPTRLFAYYSRPDKPGKYPAILNIHGAGLGVLHPNKTFAKQGFACLSIDWAGEAATRKTPRKPPFSEFASSGNMASTESGKWKMNSLEDNGIRVGVVFARRALEFLRQQPDVDKHNIFVVGASAGAHLSLILLGLEPEIKAAVVKYGTGFIRDIRGFYGGYFGPISLCSKADQDAWLAHFDPKHVIKNYQAKVLLLSGTDDIFFWMPVVLKTYRNIPSEKRLLMRPNDNHRLVGNEAISAKFFREAMSGKLDGWPSVAAPVIKAADGKLAFSVDVTSAKEIKRVSLVYKVMPLPFAFKGNKKYPWLTLDMKVAGKGWSAELPAVNNETEQLVAYVNVEDVAGGLASSDTVEYPQWPRWRGQPGEDRRPKVVLSAENLLGKRGEFEKKSGFHFTGKATVDTTGQHARTGKGAAYVFDGDKNYIASGLPAVVGKKFVLKGWFKSADPAGGSARLQINWNGSKPFKYNIHTPKISGDFQELKLQGTIPPGAKSGLLIITSPGQGMYVDDLEYNVGE
jgi:dienelactone hydrolase